MVIEFILLLVGAYLLGSVPTAYLIAKWTQGIDIRQYGSGNVGASNVAAVVSKRWFIPVTVVDLTKGVMAVWVAQWLGLSVTQQMAAGLATIIGHNWSVFLRFSGGRGIFTSLGVILILTPKLGLLALVLVGPFVPFRKVSLGALIALIFLPLLSWFLSQPLGITARLPITLGYLALLLIAVSRRLTALRSPISASVPYGKLLVNRLLFDRDIRDRKAWVSQTPPEASLAEPTLEQEEPRQETPPIS